MLERKGGQTTLDRPQIPELAKDFIDEYKTQPHTPELLTGYWQAKWQIYGDRIGRNITVPKCDRTQEEIEEFEHLPIPRKLVYVPEDIDLVTLGKMFPEIYCWAFSDDLGSIGEEKKGGWFDIETSADSPNTNKTTAEIVQLFASQGLGGQRLITYVIGSRDCYELSGRYFDEDTTWSRLPGFKLEDYPSVAHLHSGDLSLEWDLHPKDHYSILGARSERHYNSPQL